MPDIGDVKVVRTEDKSNYGYHWTVTFLNSEHWQGISDSTGRFFNVPSLSLINKDGAYYNSDGFGSGEFNKTTILSYSAGGYASTFSGTDSEISVSTLVEAMDGYEQQSVRIECYTGEVNGTYTLSYNGFTTPALLASADAATVESALEALDGMGDVTVRRRNQSSQKKMTEIMTYPVWLRLHLLQLKK